MTDPASVLIVDDSALFARILSDLCTAFGLSVVGVAGTVADGLRRARAASPAFVLMDLVLPDGDGLSATVTLRAEMPEVVVIVISARDDVGYVALARAAGAVGFIAKARLDAELGPLLRSTGRWS